MEVTGVPGLSNLCPGPDLCIPGPCFVVLSWYFREESRSEEGTWKEQESGVVAGETQYHLSGHFARVLLENRLTIGVSGHWQGLPDFWASSGL